MNTRPDGVRRFSRSTFGVLASLLFGSLLLSSTPVLAQAFFGPQSVAAFRLHANYGMLRLSASPPSTCTNYYDHLHLDTTTQFGKQALTVILTAQTTNRQLYVWYSHSTAPGTNETNGCTLAASAKLTGVRLAD